MSIVSWLIVFKVEIFDGQNSSSGLFAMHSYIHALKLRTRAKWSLESECWNYIGASTYLDISENIIFLSGIS